MLLDPDDSSEGVSKEELEQFWGKTLAGLSMVQRRIVIELYKKSKRQPISRQDIEEQMRNLGA
jgi:hypothetical protein